MPVVVDGGSPLPAAQIAVLPPGTAVLGTTAELESYLGAHPREYAVVFGPTVPLEEATSFAAGIRVSHPAVSVIVVREKVLAAVLSSCMEAGVRDVVEQRSADRLAAAVDRARQVWAAINGVDAADGSGHGRVVTVFSPKGGVGKTTTAVNLALALSDHGRRRVCLVDLDLAFGDIAITLQLFPHHTIYDAVPAEDHLDYEMLQNLLTRHEDSLMVLAAPTQPDAKDRIRGELIGRVISSLREHFDFVIVDTAPSFEEQVLQAFDDTDECVLVATLDVPTLKNVKIALETLDLLRVAPDRRWLVLNRADAQVGLTVDKVESILGMPVTVGLPTALEVASATNAGRPIVLSHPDHPVSRGIRLLAEHLVDDVPPGDAGAAEARTEPEPKTRRFARQRR